MLWFLGTFEMGCLKPAEIVAFGEGLQQGLHASCKRSVKLFRAGLQQAHRYLRVCPDTSSSARMTMQQRCTQHSSYLSSGYI